MDKGIDTNTSQQVDMEAAKFLHKLIQDSKDEPAKLATKLYVILEHMKLSGKEQTPPYQVISRSMETVMRQHGLDIDALRSACLPRGGGSQMGNPENTRHKDKEVSDSHFGAGGMGTRLKTLPSISRQASLSVQTKEGLTFGSSSYRAQKESKAVTGLADIGMQGLRQVSLSQKSTQSSEHESPSSIWTEDSRSTNSQDRHDSATTDGHTRKKDAKKSTNKRKMTDTKSDTHKRGDNPQSDEIATLRNPKRGKQANKTGQQSKLAVTSFGYPHLNASDNSEYQECVPSISYSAGFCLKSKQSGGQISGKPVEKTGYLNQYLGNSASRAPEEGEVSSANNSYDLQRGRFLPSKSSLYALNQGKFPVPPDDSQVFVPNIVESSSAMNQEVKFPGTGIKSGTPMTADNMQTFNVASAHMHGTGKNNSGMGAHFSSYSVAKTCFPSPTINNNSSMESQDMTSKLYKEQCYELQMSEDGKDDVPGKAIRHEGSDCELETSSYNISQSTGIEDRQNMSSGNSKASHKNQSIFARSILETNSQGGQASSVAPCSATPKDATITSPSTAISGMPFKEHHLKQLRAQCLVFLAFRNNLMPRKLHLEIALGVNCPKEGVSEDGNGMGQNAGGSMDASPKEIVNSHEAPGFFTKSNDAIRTASTGSVIDTDSSSKDTTNAKEKGKICSQPGREETKLVEPSIQKPEFEARTHEMTESNAASSLPSESFDSFMHRGRRASEGHFASPFLDQSSQKGLWVNRGNSSSTCGANPHKLEGNNSSKISTSDNYSKGLPASYKPQRDLTLERVDTHPNQALGKGDGLPKFNTSDCPILDSNAHVDGARSFSAAMGHSQGTGNDGESLINRVTPPKDVSFLSSHASQVEKASTPSGSATFNGSSDAYPGSHGSNDQSPYITQKHDPRKHMTSEAMRHCVDETVSYGMANTLLEKSSEQEEEEDISVVNGIPASPPLCTTVQKLVMDYQKEMHISRQKWEAKQKKLDKKIASRQDELKEIVSSSEDSAAKTKSVIELKKLQLLPLQHRLRRRFVDNFYKSIISDMERLKSMKKHKHGRRIKQIEKYEQKMKEERQKRHRERLKEFHGELEVHREKLEDNFKTKKERWKNLNKYIKEFHKKKERIYREKIDRIQREKINLLKNNDVEGYLRMVQDAKSDRVKQLLKETEKYLHKLSSKLQDAKSMSRLFEMEMDDNRASGIVEHNDILIDDEDESDQAQHYLESNEKYYKMAHSVKESINEQPTILEGGKLREYQMNGLRWLVSLYNNHLNGILADEMGLGKTVQVISLICYLMETKNDRGPFLVVVPSSVLPGWESEISFWAPSINKIVYAGPPEERRRLFKERIVNQKFNVLLTTYEYLMNKHDRPKLSKVNWHYVIIDEGHRIKNASCKLNADLKHYQSSHRLLLTGTPLQNNLDELWALLNFLLPNIFNSSEDFSQWFNKPFESSVDTSPDEALLSEEENLLIINRLHQVLRPFVLRRLKQKVENELPEKIERLVCCEASAYQKLLMKRVEENLGSIGNTKGRTIHNTVMELRNICNHPYLSQLHVEEADTLIPVHYLPVIVRMCGKLEMLDRLLPKLKATDHRVLLFSTMTRLLDIMEEYLFWKQYKYLRLDGHTSGSERGGLIEEFNRPGSQVFIFLLSIRAGGVGVNLQAADTVIIFDTDWNPQVDLQAQARAHRIGQKKDVLVLRLETVESVEEQVRAAAEHKLGVANQSITAGFFDNNTSAEDRREYLENLLRECKKEEAQPVLDDNALNHILARSKSEIDIFESVDKRRHEEELAIWQRLTQESAKDNSTLSLSMPSRLVSEEDLKPFYAAMMIHETPSIAATHKGGLGGLDTKQYGRGKRAREVRSYEDQWTEEEFEKLCQVGSPELPQMQNIPKAIGVPKGMPLTKDQDSPPTEPAVPKESTPIKRGRGRPKRAAIDILPAVFTSTSSDVTQELGPQSETTYAPAAGIVQDHFPIVDGSLINRGKAPVRTPLLNAQVRCRKNQTRDTGRKRGRKQNPVLVTPIPEANSSIGIAKEMDKTSESIQVQMPRIDVNAPPVGYEITSISGSQKDFDLDPVGAPSPKEKAIIHSNLEKREAGNENPANTVMIAIPAVMHALQSDDVDFVTAQNKRQSSVISPSSNAMEMFMLDPSKKRHSKMEPSDRVLIDNQKEKNKQEECFQKPVRQKHAEYVEPIPSGETQNSSVAISLPSSYWLKPDDSSCKGKVTATCDNLYTGEVCNVGQSASTHHAVKPIEAMQKEETGKSSKATDMIPESGSLHAQLDAVPCIEGLLSAAKGVSIASSTKTRGPNKGSVIRKKVAAREPRNQSNSASCGSLGRFTAVKQAEDLDNTTHAENPLTLGLTSGDASHLSFFEVDKGSLSSLDVNDDPSMEFQTYIASTCSGDETDKNKEMHATKTTNKSMVPKFGSVSSVGLLHSSNVEVTRCMSVEQEVMNRIGVDKTLQECLLEEQAKGTYANNLLGSLSAPTSFLRLGVDKTVHECLLEEQGNGPDIRNSLGLPSASTCLLRLVDPKSAGDNVTRAGENKNELSSLSSAAYSCNQIISWVSPTSPGLQQIVQDGSHANKKFEIPSAIEKSGSGDVSFPKCPPTAVELQNVLSTVSSSSTSTGLVQAHKPDGNKHPSHEGNNYNLQTIQSAAEEAPTTSESLLNGQGTTNVELYSGDAVVDLNIRTIDYA